VLAVPSQSLRSEDRPALRAERGVARNILLLHAEVEGATGPEWRLLNPGPSLITRAEIGFAQWDYVALGNYHVAQEIEANGWYAGSLDYVTSNPWGELQDEKKIGTKGKGYVLVDNGRVTFRTIAPPRRFIDLPLLDAAGLTAAELDARIAQRVHDAVARAGQLSGRERAAVRVDERAPRRIGLRRLPEAPDRHSSLPGIRAGRPDSSTRTFYPNLLPEPSTRILLLPAI
jgi:DNA repair exonuclease SbcCD nuclease subunit